MGDADDEVVTLARDDFAELLAVAAEKGARRALAEVGLDGDDAPADIRDLRGLISSLRSARSTIWQTTVRLLTTVALAALIAYALPRFNLWNHGS